jgi:hypothetical protein
MATGLDNDQIGTNSVVLERLLSKLVLPSWHGSSPGSNSDISQNLEIGDIRISQLLLAQKYMLKNV